STLHDIMHVTYGCLYTGNSMCTATDLPNVGSLPLGVGYFGHFDLSGSVNEWAVDAFAPYLTPCNDCANIGTDLDAGRIARGGGFETSSTNIIRQRAASRASLRPTLLYEDVGVRCAR